MDASPERSLNSGLDGGRVKLSCQDGRELERREGVLRGHRCRRGGNDGSEEREERGGVHVGLEG